MQRTKLKSIHEVNFAKELVTLFGGREISLGQYMIHCPAHNDRTPSLSVRQSGDNILLHCFAGCSYSDILNSLESRSISLGKSDFQKSIGLPTGISGRWDGKQYTAHWAYKNESGEIIGYVVRYESSAGDKDIIPYFKKDGDQWKAGYTQAVKDKRPLYNLDKIDQAPDEQEIWVVEGEKSADALSGIGGCITTTALGGSNSAGKADWMPLKGKRVVIWPDKDQAGKTYAANVFRGLTEVNENEPDVRIIDVEQLPLGEKEDAYDWVKKGFGFRDVLSLPQIPVKDISDVGVIVVDPGRVFESIDTAERLLIKVDPYHIFQRSGMVVRVVKNIHKRVAGDEVHSVGLTDVLSGYLLDLFNRKLVFVKMGRDGLENIDPPSKIANRYLARKGHWKLYPLSGLIYAPTLKPDGTVLESPGYDEASGIYYDNTGARFSPIKKDPEKEDALRSLNRLRHPLRDFPFVGEEDESVALAAILTSLVRPSLRTAPMFAFTAPVAGSGKTLLANIVAIIATGKQAVVTTSGSDKEEEKKHLFASLLQGKPVILLDNIEKPLSGEVLCAILTAPGGTYSDRILGKSETVEVPTNVTFLATGNNLTFVGDMTRRALLCTIDPKRENPEARRDFHIRGPLENHVMNYRETYVRAGLILLKAYIRAGKPKQNIPQYGSFEDWSGWVRSALVWVGCADPNLTRIKIEQEDPVKTILSGIISLWRKIYGEDVPVKVSDIVFKCNKAVDNKDHDSEEYELAQIFQEATRSRGKQIQGSQVGVWLRSNQGKYQDGFKIIKNPSSPKTGTAEWILTT